MCWVKRHQFFGPPSEPLIDIAIGASTTCPSVFPTRTIVTVPASLR